MPGPPVLPPPSLYPPRPDPLPPSSTTASHGRSTFVTALIITGSVLAFLTLFLSSFLFFRHTRQRRRRRQREEALLEAAAMAPDAPPAAAAALDADEEIVHHAWHIRTVGLDEAAIQSIALTRHRAGGELHASDCTVCLGEFHDGELLRLLPNCAHAFHVQCIDTWLRAHVTCPLCRATVMVPAVAAGEQPEPTPPAAGDDAEQEQDAVNIVNPEHERQLAQIEQRDQESSWPERRHRVPVPRAQNFRRVASMDMASPIVLAVEDREHEQAGGATKQGTGGGVCCEESVSPASDQLSRAAMKRSLSAGSRWVLLSRHCRTRTSLLPL